jgi:mannosyltransferase OCH1-like enzyme
MSTNSAQRRPELIPEFLPKRKTAGRSSNIPRVIVQTMKSPLVPTSMLRAVRSWIEQNPEYDYRFFDDRVAKSRHGGESMTAPLQN